MYVLASLNKSSFSLLCPITHIFLKPFSTNTQYNTYPNNPSPQIAILYSFPISTLLIAAWITDVISENTEILLGTFSGILIKFLTGNDI